MVDHYAANSQMIDVPTYAHRANQQRLGLDGLAKNRPHKCGNN